MDKKYFKKNTSLVLGIFDFSNNCKIGAFDIIRSPDVIEHYTGVKPNIKNFAYLQKKTCDKLLDLSFLYDEELTEDAEFNWNGFIVKKNLYTAWIKKRPFSNVEELKKYVLKEIDEITDWKPGEAWDWWGKRNEEDYRSSYLKAIKDMENTTTIYASSPVFLDVLFYRAGMDLFWYLFYEEPELVFKWWDCYIEHEIKRVNDIADPGICPIVFIDCDIAGKNRLLASPDFLRNHYFPRLKKIISAWKSFGYKIIYHSDGFVLDIISDLVDSGIDALHPIDVTAGMNLIDTRGSYKDLVLIGGIDAIGILSNGKKGDSTKELARVSELIGSKGGLFLGSSLELNPGSKLENIIEMFNYIDKLKKYFNK